MAYTVTVGSEVEEHPTREAAIAAAKDRSKVTRGEITVSDSRGAEVLTYRGGELASYLWDDRR